MKIAFKKEINFRNADQYGSIPFCVYEFLLDCIKLTFTNKPARPARTKNYSSHLNFFS
jgi:hypothetical protein